MWVVAVEDLLQVYTGEPKRDMVFYEDYSHLYGFLRFKDYLCDFSIKSCVCLFIESSFSLFAGVHDKIHVHLINLTCRSSEIS